MPDPEGLARRFGDLATTDLPVPASASVVARGRQRRRRRRVLAATATLAVAAVIGTAAGYIQHTATRAPSPQASSTSKPHPTPSAVTLPPSGTGMLMLGLEGSGFGMARSDSSAAPVRLPRLLAAPGASVDLGSLIAANPAGGWVVSYATSSKSDNGAVPTRLAIVSATGVVTPFGPAFAAQLLPVGLAVRPGGSAVAVGLRNSAGNSEIMLVPLPGHGGTVRSWILPAAVREVSRPQPISMSFNPSGSELTYFVGHPTGGGVSTDGAVTLDVTAPGHVAPTEPAWPPDTKKPGSCNGIAGAWDGSSYLALEQCSGDYELRVVNAVTGSLAGRSVVVPVPWGCAASEVFPAAGGHQVLISACGTFLVAGAHATTLTRLPLGAVWIGGQ